MYLSGSVNRDNKLLLLVGDGPERSNIARLIKEWALESNIKIITHLPNVEVRNLYRYSKCLILDSLPTSVWQEQFGHVLAEAIIADCPVISNTYSGAIPEVMEGAGLLCAPGNSVEIKKALIMLDDEPLYDKLKTNCAKIKYKFNPKYFRDKLLGYCQELKLLN